MTPIVVATFFALRLARGEPAFRPRTLAGAIALACCASLPVAIVCSLIGWTLPLPHNPFVGLATLGAVALPAGLAYAALAARLGLREPMTILGLFGRRLHAVIRH
jgi:hypothetical protein